MQGGHGDRLLSSSGCCFCCHGRCLTPKASQPPATAAHPQRNRARRRPGGSLEPVREAHILEQPRSPVSAVRPRPDTGAHVWLCLRVYLCGSPHMCVRVCGGCVFPISDLAARRSEINTLEAVGGPKGSCFHQSPAVGGRRMQRPPKPSPKTLLGHENFLRGKRDATSGDHGDRGQGPAIPTRLVTPRALASDAVCSRSCSELLEGEAGQGPSLITNMLRFHFESH